MRGVPGDSNKRVSLAALIAVKAGRRPPAGPPRPPGPPARGQSQQPPHSAHADTVFTSTHADGIDLGAAIWPDDVMGGRLLEQVCGSRADPVRAARGQPRVGSLGVQVVHSVT
jgi:hypothetical protein